MRAIRNIVIAIILTAIVTQNYIITHADISGMSGNYTLTVFGQIYSYK